MSRCSTFSTFCNACNNNETHGLSVNHRQLRVASINFQSISNKVSSFQEFIHNYDPDIILGCESWLTIDISSNEIFPSNYNIFRKNRQLKQGGGVFICCEDIISCKEVRINNECEAVVCQITLKNNGNLIICSFYRPPTHDMQYATNLVPRDMYYL